MPTIWLCGGFGWLCPAFRDWMLDVRRSMFDVPDREPSRFAAGRNGLGCWTFWRLLALVAAANRDGSRSDPELDVALPRYVPSRNTLGFSLSRHSLPLSKWPLNPNRSSTPRSSANRCGLSSCRKAWGTGSPSFSIGPVSSLPAARTTSRKPLCSGSHELLRASETVGRELTHPFYALYADIRQRVLSRLCRENSPIAPQEIRRCIRKLLARVLLCAFCEDRGLLPAESLKHAFEHRDPYNPK